MSNLNPVVECQMLIKKPVAEVFKAFQDPPQTTNFWFTKSTGILEEGQNIEWNWEMYGITIPVKVNKIAGNEFIGVEWGDPKENIDFTFTPTADGSATYVIIRNYGFTETGDDLIRKLIDTTGGFTTVLDGAKCWLEHGFNLNLIADKFPKEFMHH